MSPRGAMGKVYLVGAGPGDPDLLTVKAARLLAEADAVVYDALVHHEILDLAAPGAVVLYVGKRGGDHHAEQEDINELLVDLAARHRVVVRLKGGDPYLFGRGAEEQEHLAARGVPVEVVPGVTSAIAVPAYAGIPLTHRDHAALAAIATGHRRDGAAAPVDFRALGGLDGTVVVLMGVRQLESIAEALLEGGRPAATPAALVEWGTTPRQRVLTAPLGALAARASAEAMEPPCVLLVGPVVALREKLDWFGRRPLLGRRVLVAREAARPDPLSRGLGRLGAEVLALPSRAFQGQLAGELEGRLAGGLDVLVVLSATGLDALAATVGLDAVRAALGSGPCLAADAAVAEGLREAGLEARLVDAPTAEAVAAALAGR